MARALFLLPLILLFLKTSATSIYRRGGMPFNKVDAQRAVAMILDDKKPRQIVPLIRWVNPYPIITDGSEHKTLLRKAVAINPETDIRTIAIVTASEFGCEWNNNFNLDLQAARDAFYAIIDRIDQGLDTSSPETVVRAGCNVYELTTGPKSAVHGLIKEPAIYGKSSPEDIQKDFVCAQGDRENACKCWFNKIPHIWDYIVFNQPQANCLQVTLETFLGRANMDKLTFLTDM